VNCESARERLLDRAYGELAPGEARELEAHLAGCAACRAEAARIEETRGLYRRLGEEPAPGGEGILLAAARQAAGEARPRRPRLLAWPRVAVGVALVLVVGGVSVAILSVRRERPSEEAYATAGEARPAAAERAPGAVEAERKGAPRETYAVPPPAAPREQPPAAVARRAEGPRVAGKAMPEAAPVGAAVPERQAATADQARAAARPSSEGAVAGLARAPPPPGEAPPAGAPPPGPAPAEAAAARPEAARRKLEAQRAPLGVPVAGGGAGEAEALADSLVRDLRRRRDAGELSEARREPDPCPGGDRVRVAWLDGWGRAWRLSRTAPLPAGMGAGEATRDQYYDGSGRLRVAVVDGTGPDGHFRRRIVLDEAGRRLVEDPPGSPWPEGDLVLRDAAAAFWAPQRCGR
jgi:hypothetical protein